MDFAEKSDWEWDASDVGDGLPFDVFVDFDALLSVQSVLMVGDAVSRPLSALVNDSSVDCSNLWREDEYVWSRLFAVR